MNENQNLRNKRKKGQFTYSEVISDEFKKFVLWKIIQNIKEIIWIVLFLYCFKIGMYSPMNYAPFNNMIKRREVTPFKRIRKNVYDGQNNIRFNKTDIKGDNDYNFYLSED